MKDSKIVSIYVYNVSNNVIPHFRLRGVDVLSQSEILKMRHDLSLLSEADFRIVLAQAEKSRNGIILFLFGDESQYNAKNQAIKTSYV